MAAGFCTGHHTFEGAAGATMLKKPGKITKEKNQQDVGGGGEKAPDGG